MQNGFLEFFDKDRMQNRRETDILGDAIGTVLTYTAVGVGVVAGLAMFFKR